MAMSEVARRRQDLYGPGRTRGKDAAKKLQQEDHVNQNFQRGAGIDLYDSRDAFQTVTAKSFREQSSSKVVRSPWDPSTQNATHIQLGSDRTTEHHSSVLKADYGVKPLTQYKQHLPSGLHLTNIPDMASRYMADKTFGRSLYVADFDGDKSYGAWSSRMAEDGKKVGRRQKTTLFQKNTHFELGSDPPSMESETTNCFTARPPPVAMTTSSLSVDKSKSNVFRAEDFDKSLGKDRFLSVQRKDFDSLPAGVSTATTVGYSHVLPSHRGSMAALSSLRRLLIDKNIKEFHNPRDPTAINITKAFLKYDKNRSGCIDINELRAVCQQLGTPITDEEIGDLLKECDQNGDGKLDYTEFIKFLSAYNPDPAEQDQNLVSTSADTYSARPQTADEANVEDAFMGGAYQTSTHFHFGDSDNPSSSIYHQDFGCDEVQTSRKSLPLPPPLSSKVMHEFPLVAGGNSTSRRDFVRHDIVKREGQRLDGLRTNKERHSKLAVELRTGGQDNVNSVMTSSYGAPPTGTKPSLPVNPAPQDYYHLESNRALPHPPKGPISSEAHDNFHTPLSDSEECLTKRCQALGERRSRISDNKNTHFVLGFNDTNTLSEKMVEFGDKAPVDPHLPAAGKPNLPTKAYSVIEHDAGSTDDQSDHLLASSEESASTNLQGLLQQRNYLKNMNPRDPLNINLRKAFLEYDKDLSGTISKDEVKAVCREMGVGVGEEELDTIISRCDKNGTNQIDYHDFALNLSRQDPPGSTRNAPITTTTRKDFKDPQGQQMSGMQRLVMEQDGKRHVPVHSTHFFHLDSRDNYLMSTTMKDFMCPEKQ